MGITLPADRTGYLLYDSDCGICLAMAGFLAKRVTRAPRLACPDRGRHGAAGGAPGGGRPLTTTIHFVRGDDTVLTGATGRACGRPTRPALAVPRDRARQPRRSRSPRAALPTGRDTPPSHRSAARSPGRVSAPAAEGRDRLTIWAARSAPATERDPPVTAPSRVRPLDQDLHHRHPMRERQMSLRGIGDLSSGAVADSTSVR